uniref:Nucleoprotein n=2 Tax=Phlebovirus TaxID=11584 RepID=A7KCK0_9VIRU|nr:nucleocapsid [Phlebovirus sp. Be An 356637]
MADYARIAVEFSGEAINLAEIQGWVTDFAYQGFDARRIVELVQQKGGAGWKDDVKMMIVLCLTRGNKPTKMVEKMSPEGKVKVNRLISTYGLKSGNPGRDDITLSRVAAAFAGWTCQALNVLHPHLPVSGTTMDAISPNYPRAMMHPSFAGLVDQTIPTEYCQTIVDAMSVFLIQFSRTINKSLRGQPKEVVIESFIQPMQAAMSSSFIAPAERRKLMIALGIVDANGKPSANVAAAAAVFPRLL